MNNDSQNAIEDKDERPQGLCYTCEKDCYSDWVIILCSEYTEAKCQEIMRNFHLNTK
jgi:hypothetical protein